MKAYQQYLNEKLGGTVIDRDEYDQVLDDIAQAVIKNEKGLGKFISQKVIDTGDTIKIVKELFKNPSNNEKRRVLDKVMEIEALWEMDTEDVYRALEYLHFL